MSRKGRYVAFLRAINVGGHTVRMDRLRALFEALKFGSVETFIASGNVIFETSAKGDRRLEERIESHLRTSLGYDVATFLRSTAELRGILDYSDALGTDESTRTYISFAHAPLSKAQVKAVQAFDAEGSTFHVNGRDIYWLRATQGVEFPTGVEKAMGGLLTMRNLNTVRRLVTRVKEAG